MDTVQPKWVEGLLEGETPLAHVDGDDFFSNLQKAIPDQSGDLGLEVYADSLVYFADLLSEFPEIFGNAELSCHVFDMAEAAKAFMMDWQGDDTRIIGLSKTLMDIDFTTPPHFAGFESLNNWGVNAYETLCKAYGFLHQIDPQEALLHVKTTLEIVREKQKNKTPITEEVVNRISQSHFYCGAMLENTAKIPNITKPAITGFAHASSVLKTLLFEERLENLKKDAIDEALKKCNEALEQGPMSGHDSEIPPHLEQAIEAILGALKNALEQDVGSTFSKPLMDELKIAQSFCKKILEEGVLPLHALDDLNFIENILDLIYDDKGFYSIEVKNDMEDAFERFSEIDETPILGPPTM